ncbi:MAG: YceI family protein [Chloroflexi bacterium]|nr:YceI family protein [Chloroflexota bacterium]MYI04917.1 YceI family protein [Chloroflexota bacterium]
MPSPRSSTFPYASPAQASGSATSRHLTQPPLSTRCCPKTELYITETSPVLSQILNLSPRRLISVALLVGAALLAALLIVLWQLGVFDSAPPPATLQSAVESLRQDDQEQQSAAQDPAQPDQQSSLDQQVSPQQADGQSAASDPGSADGQSDSVQSPATSDSQQAYVNGYGDQYEDSDAARAEDDEAQQQTQQTQPGQDQQQRGQPAAAESPSLADLAGSWIISERGESFVGYRIGEEIADIGTTTAVGRTGQIEASLEFDGAVITSVVITADLRTLRSDQSFRDGALRTRGIESDTYPFATFTLAEPIPIGALPTKEESLSVTVQGTLDLHGVTNPVSIALSGQFVDGLVVVVGSTEIALADYNIEKPTTARVFSIDDVGIMEFQLVFERAP